MEGSYRGARVAVRRSVSRRISCLCAAGWWGRPRPRSKAAAAYRGELLAGTDAPGLTGYRDYLAVAVREALLARPDPQAVLRYAEAVPHDVDVLERALRALGSAPHAARPLLRARLRTAYEH